MKLINIWAVTRWLLLGIAFALMALVGILFFHIIYPVECIWGWKKYTFGWFFVNRDEKDKISNLYGDEGWRRDNDIEIEDMTGLWGIFQRSYVAFRWMALRNPSWNFKLLIAPKTGIKEDVEVLLHEGPVSALTFRNHTIFGEQFAFFTVGGTRYFRFSVSKPVKLFWIWHRQWIVQFGTSDIRYIYKNKWSSK
jgi:hypothetical protein